MSWSQNGIDFVCQQFGDLDECVVSTGLVFDYTDVQGNSFSGVVGGTPDIVAFIVLGLVESITMKTPSRAPIPAPQTMLNNMNGSSISLADAQELTNHDENSADQWCYTGPTLCTNPPGAEGEDPCGDGGTNQPLTDHKYMCIDGAWVDQGFNPICTAVNCTNPVGEDGQTIPCGDGGTNQPLTDHAYKCINGSWLDQGLNPDCAMLCSEYTDKPSCETADCYWYKKFIWEQESCHSKPLDPMEQYLIYGGIAAAGIAVIILLARR